MLAQLARPQPQGGATAQEIAELARLIQAKVKATFGLLLTPESVFVGF